MTSPSFQPTNAEEPPRELYRPEGGYSPVMWVVVWVMRAMICAQVLSARLLGGCASPPPIEAPKMFHRNRQLRRARESCLRRARRCMIKHGKINPEDYTPRAYAHFAYVNMMDKSMSPGQFMESYIRDNDESRVQVCGLDNAHNISAYIPGGSLSRLCAVLSACLPSGTLSLAAPCDPAPP